MGGRSPLLPKGLRGPLADLHLPPGREFTPRTKKWLGEGVDVLLSPQPRSNKGVIDDLDAVALPRPRRGNQLQYESSVFSPPGGPVTPLRRGPKMVPGSDKSELREMLRSPRMDQNPDETQFKRRKRVLASYDAMKQVVQKLDTSRTGAITARDLNNALDKLGIKMRHGDFKRLAADVDPSMQRDGGLTHLPALGRVLDEPARRRGEGRPSLAGAGGRRRATGRGGERMKAEASGGWRKMLEEKVSRHWKQLQRDFKRLDPQRSGLVDMHHLIPALEVYGINLQTEDADALYLQMGVGRTGKINWGEFLKCYSGALSRRPGAISAPPDMMASKLELRGNANRGLESSVTVPKNIEGYLRSICTQWRAIRQACQIMDKGLSKVLTRHQFKGILLKLGASAPDPILEAVCQNYRQKQGPGGHGSVAHQGNSRDNGEVVRYNLFIKDLATMFPSA